MRRVGITLAYAGCVGLRAVDQHRTNGCHLSWSDEQNEIGLTSFVHVGPTKLPTNCQRWSNKWLLSGYILLSVLFENFTHIKKSPLSVSAKGLKTWSTDSVSTLSPERPLCWVASYYKPVVPRISSTQGINREKNNCSGNIICSHKRQNFLRGVILFNWHHAWISWKKGLI